MNRITHIRVRNLACFADLVLRPGDTTLLIGGNGSGKSTLFDLLFDLYMLIAEGESASAVLPAYQTRDGIAQLEVELATPRGALRYELSLSHPAAWTISRERLCLGDSPLYDFSGGVFQSADTQGTIALAQDRVAMSTVAFPDDSAVSTFKRWADGIWMLRLEPQQMSSSAEDADDALDVSGANFVAWLLGIPSRARALKRICEIVRPSIPRLSALALKRSGREYVLVARFEGGEAVDFDRLSDGQRCLIVLYAVLTLLPRRCPLLLLDEPDAHVTPTEILPLFTAIREQVASAGSQVMVASHHPQVIDMLAADTPWELTMGADGAVVAEPFVVSRAEGLSASRHLLLRGRR